MPETNPPTAGTPKKTRGDSSISLTQFDEKITKILKKSPVRLTRDGVRRIRENFLRDALNRITPEAVLPLVQEEISKLGQAR